MLWKFPLKIPINRSVLVTQGFKDTSLVDWYQSKGINITSHEAVDVVTGTNVETYGTPVVCPFPTARPLRWEPGPAMGKKGSAFQIRYVDDHGTEWIMGGLHCSELVRQELYREGDVIGYVGNAGSVFPEPTFANPYAGAHLHLTLICNGQVVNPLDYFDTKNPFRGDDTGLAKDLPPAHWAVRGVLAFVEKITGYKIAVLPNNT